MYTTWLLIIIIQPICTGMDCWHNLM